MEHPDNTQNKVLAQLQAIRKEVFLTSGNRKETTSKWLFHPESTFRVIWDFFLIFFVLYQAYYVPLSMCFEISLSPSLYFFEVVSVCVFLMDIRTS